MTLPADERERQLFEAALGESPMRCTISGNYVEREMERMFMGWELARALLPVADDSSPLVDDLDDVSIYEPTQEKAK